MCNCTQHLHCTLPNDYTINGKTCAVLNSWVRLWRPGRIRNSAQLSCQPDVKVILNHILDCTNLKTKHNHSYVCFDGSYRPLFVLTRPVTDGVRQTNLHIPSLYWGDKINLLKLKTYFCLMWHKKSYSVLNTK